MQNEKISRHQFLRKMGLGGSALLAVYCAGTLSSCENEAAEVAIIVQAAIIFIVNRLCMLVSF